jgi:hypothetical protein
VDENLRLIHALGSFPDCRRCTTLPNVCLNADEQEGVTVLKLLPAQLPWWLGGPGMGLCVVALYGLANRRLVVSGAWLAAVVAPIEGWRGEHWRVEFLIALVTGALTAGLIGGLWLRGRTEPVATMPRLATPTTAAQEASHATAG